MRHVARGQAQVTIGRPGLYEQACAAAPDLRGQLEALNRIARATAPDPDERARVQTRLFHDHGQAAS